MLLFKIGLFFEDCCFSLSRKGNESDNEDIASFHGRHPAPLLEPFPMTAQPFFLLKSSFFLYCYHSNSSNYRTDKEAGNVEFAAAFVAASSPFEFL